MPLLVLLARVFAISPIQGILDGFANLDDLVRCHGLERLISVNSLVQSGLESIGEALGNP